MGKKINIGGYIVKNILLLFVFMFSFAYGQQTNVGVNTTISIDKREIDAEALKALRELYSAQLEGIVVQKSVLEELEAELESLESQRSYYNQDGAIVYPLIGGALDLLGLYFAMAYYVNVKFDLQKVDDVKKLINDGKEYVVQFQERTSRRIKTTDLLKERNKELKKSIKSNLKVRAGITAAIGGTLTYLFLQNLDETKTIKELTQDEYNKLVKKVKEQKIKIKATEARVKATQAALYKL
jgi:hypothetical protein